jgi:SOS-response transcriptional repressor LexA
MNETNLILSENLQYLMKIHGGLSISELARQTQLPQPTLHHILNGSTKKPRKEALNALAKFFSISVAQLVGTLPLLPTIPDAIKDSLKITTIPIIDWEMVKIWPKTNGNKSSSDKEIILDRQVDKNSFALLMRDSSMEPMFTEKSILIFDPAKKTKDRDFSIVYLSSNEIMFNRLLIDGSGYYIKQDQKNGNAQLIKLKLDTDIIIATLIEVRLQF